MCVLQLHEGDALYLVKDSEKNLQHGFRLEVCGSLRPRKRGRADPGSNGIAARLQALAGCFVVLWDKSHVRTLQETVRAQCAIHAKHKAQCSCWRYINSEPLCRMQAQRHGAVIEEEITGATTHVVAPRGMRAEDLQKQLHRIGRQDTSFYPWQRC